MLGPFNPKVFLRQRLPGEASLLPPLVVGQVAEGEHGPPITLFEGGVKIGDVMGLGGVVPENAGPRRDCAECGRLVAGIGDLQVTHQHRRAIDPRDHLDGNRANLVPQFHHSFLRPRTLPFATGRADETPAVMQRLPIDFEFEGVDRASERVQPRQTGEDILPVHMPGGGPVEPDPAAVFEYLLAHSGVRDVTGARPGGGRETEFGFGCGFRCGHGLMV